MNFCLRNLVQMATGNVIAGAMFVGLTVSAAQASQCTHIRSWLALSFDTEHIQPMGQRLDGTTGAAICGNSMMMSGMRSRHCAWPFAFRADAARQVFEDLTKLIAQCVGPQTISKGKGRVNHPDSYDQRTFQTDTGTVSLSLKDKGNLGETYIFLRFDVVP